MPSFVLNSVIGSRLYYFMRGGRTKVELKFTLYIYNLENFISKNKQKKVNQKQWCLFFICLFACFWWLHSVNNLSCGDFWAISPLFNSVLVMWKSVGGLFIFCERSLCSVGNMLTCQLLAVSDQLPAIRTIFNN